LHSFLSRMQLEHRFWASSGASKQRILRRRQCPNRTVTLSISRAPPDQDSYRTPPRSGGIRVCCGACPPWTCLHLRARWAWTRIVSARIPDVCWSFAAGAARRSCSSGALDERADATRGEPTGCQSRTGPTPIRVRSWAAIGSCAPRPTPWQVLWDGSPSRW
jgi:hypothetical protein